MVRRPIYPPQPPPPICPLCKVGTDLVRSHIVPEFMYRPMFDSKHRCMLVSANPEIRDEWIQTGLKEPLLCSPCDNELLGGNYESYGKQFLASIQPLAWPEHWFALTGFDYAKVRLFLLSILWRMSVSQHWYYRSVELGPHAERVRQMLINNDPGKPEEYGISCIAPIFEGDFLPGIMLPPQRVKAAGRTVYRVMMGGFLFFFYVGNATLDKTRLKLFPQRDNTWLIGRKDAAEIEFVREAWEKTSIAIHKREV